VIDKAEENKAEDDQTAQDGSANNDQIVDK